MAVPVEPLVLVAVFLSPSLLYQIMSGRGKARKPAGGKKHTKSTRAGLVMPVSRVHRYLKKGRYARRTSIAASVYMSAVIEYLVAEVNELSGNAAKANKRYVFKYALLHRHYCLFTFTRPLRWC